MAKQKEIDNKEFDGLTFEEAMQKLEKLVSDFEKGQLPLDKSVEAYQMGTKLVDFLRTTLSQAEEKLKIVNDK
jgi:exodeoxyribonuclease VII small subunit